MPFTPPTRPAIPEIAIFRSVGDEHQEPQTFVVKVFSDKVVLEILRPSGDGSMKTEVVPFVTNTAAMQKAHKENGPMFSERIYGAIEKQIEQSWSDTVQEGWSTFDTTIDIDPSDMKDD